MQNLEERAIGCFTGLAVGDAIGKQTETLSLQAIRKWYPGGIAGFHGRPGDVIPRYAGKRYEWRIGETTDDTEQTIAVARALLKSGEVRHEEIGRELMQCRKSVHPDLSIWTLQQSGNPARVAPDGDGCGAAMRVAPVGVMYPLFRLEELVHGAYECSIPTHGGPLAIAAAAAVAGAVSAAMEGADVLATALAAADAAGQGGSEISRSIREIHADLRAMKHLTPEIIAERWFPDRPQTKVPLAICLAAITGSAEETALLAANIGGDSDSVASIGGAIAGALRPETVNQEWFEVVNAVNGDDPVDLAGSLAARRIPST